MSPETWVQLFVQVGGLAVLAFFLWKVEPARTQMILNAISERDALYLKEAGSSRRIIAKLAWLIAQEKASSPQDVARLLEGLAHEDDELSSNDLRGAKKPII